MCGKRGIFLIFILVLGMIPSTSIDLQSGNERSFQSPKILHTALTAHDRILIASNEDFETQALNEGWTGNGTEINPYVIEDLNMTIYGWAVSIRNTSVHFRIQNCLIKRTNYTQDSHLNTRACLNFINVSHGAVENCEIVSDLYTVDILYSTHCKIEHSEIFETVILYYSDYCSILNNTFSDFDDTRNSGITSWYSTGAKIAFNELYTIDLDLGVTNFIVRNNTVLLFMRLSCNNSFIVNNTCDSCTIQNSINLTIINNEFNSYYFTFLGSEIEHWNTHTIENNLFNERPILYFNGLGESSIDVSDAGLVILSSCYGTGIQGGSFQYQNTAIVAGFCQDCVIEGSTGFEIVSFIELFFCNNTLISNNDAINCTYSYSAHDSNNIQIVGNTAFGSTFGVEVFSSQNCIIDSNIFSNLIIGIRIHDSSYLLIKNNTISFCYSDGLVGDPSNSLIIDNIIFKNKGWGINFGRDSFNNVLYNNTLWGNSPTNAYDTGVSNQWDDGVSIGNVWDDYDGVGVYNIPGDAESVDRFPRVYILTMTTSSVISSSTLVSTDKTTTPSSITTSSLPVDNFLQFILLILLIVIVSLVIFIMLVYLRIKSQLPNAWRSSTSENA